MPTITMNLGNHRIEINLTDAELLNEDGAIISGWIAPALMVLLDSAYPGRRLAKMEALMEALREQDKI